MIKYAITSDVHLPLLSSEKLKLFYDFLVYCYENVEYLVLNGDIIDFQKLSLAECEKFFEEAEREINRISERLSRSKRVLKGIKYISGNHDDWTRICRVLKRLVCLKGVETEIEEFSIDIGYNSDRNGRIVYTNKFYFNLGGNSSEIELEFLSDYYVDENVIILHGHQFDKNFGKWNFWNIVLDYIEYKLSQITGIYLRKYVLYTFKFFYEKMFYEQAKSFHKKLGAQCMILGHTHLPEKINYDGKEIYNTGTWLNEPYVVLILNRNFVKHQKVVEILTK